MAKSFAPRFGVFVVIAAVLCSMFGAPVTSSQSAQTTRLAGVRKSRRNVRTEEALAMSRAFGHPDTSWLLERGVYDNLSSGGRVAAQYVNGIQPKAKVHPEAAPRQIPASSGPTSPGQNVKVSPWSGAYRATESETSIAVNGATIVESFNDSFDINPYGLSSYAISKDGGVSFSYQQLPEADSELNLGDGVVAFGPGGELYYSEIAAGPDGVFIGVCRALDGVNFRTISNASTTAVNTKDFQDKPWIAVDKSPASPFKGNVYVSWTDFTHNKGAFINVAASTNSANSFHQPVAVSPKSGGQLVQGSFPAVAPNGDLYVAYFDGGLNSGGIRIVKSTDGGATFSTPRTVAIFNPIGPMTGCESVRTNSFPSMSIDGSGNIHIVFNAQTVTPGPDRSDIYYVRSTDGGATFTAPVRVNDDQTSTSQYFPSVVATSSGTIGIKWCDRRNDPINDALTDVYMAISTTDGASFGPNFRITDNNWTYGPVEPELDYGYHGDYDGIATDGTNFYLSWSDERGGDPDAYFTFIPVNANPVQEDFNISATNLYDTAALTSSSQIELSTTATNGFSGNLTLSARTVTGDPLVYTFSTNPVPAGATATLTLAGSYGDSLITVTATSAGISRSTNLRAEFAGASVIATHTSGFTTLNAGLVCDSSGVAHTLFDDDTGVAGGGKVYYEKSSDGGKTYSTPRALTDGSETSFDSALCVDSAGNLYAAWTTLSGGSERIFVSKSSDHGATFSTPVPVTPTTQETDLARIVAGPDGSITCSYLDFSSGTTRLFAVRSGDGGASFSVPAQVSLPGEVVDTLGHSLRADSMGNAFIVYVDDSSVPMVKFATLNGAGAFNRSAPVSDPTLPSFAPDIAVDKNGAVNVVYYSVFEAGQAAERREIMFTKSCNLGSDFCPPVNVTYVYNHPQQARFPVVAVDGNGIVYVAWEDAYQNDPFGNSFMNNEEDIFWASDGGGGVTFDPLFPRDLSNNPGFSTHARLAIDPNNNVIVQWSDDSTAESDLFTAGIGGSPAVPPAFALLPRSPAVSVHRGSKVQIPVYIDRIGGFSDTVTVAAPDTSALKILMSPATLSTTCCSVTFDLKIKKRAPLGPHQLTFTGTDSHGTVVTGSASIQIE